jgi:heme O synthase-like polyprenyltransferase
VRFLTVLGYSLLCAGLLTLFSQIQDLLKYLFSLGALYVGVQFFKRHEERGMRITFVISTIVLYFLFAVAYAIYLTIQSGQLPPNPA